MVLAAAWLWISASRETASPIPRAVSFVESPREERPSAATPFSQTEDTTHRVPVHEVEQHVVESGVVPEPTSVEGIEEKVEAANRSPYFAFHLRIVDGSTGSPMSGLPVVVTNGMTPGEITDARGETVIWAPRSMAGPADIEPEGYVPVRVPLRPGHETRETAFELALVRTARLEGRILDGLGVPVKGVTIEVRSEGGWKTVQSGSDGRFKLSELTPNVDLGLKFDHQSMLVQAPADLIRLVPDETLRLDLTAVAKSHQ
jgi:hypothetical protein